MKLERSGTLMYNGLHTSWISPFSMKKQKPKGNAFARQHTTLNLSPVAAPGGGDLDLALGTPVLSSRSFPNGGLSPTRGSQESLRRSRTEYDFGKPFTPISLPRAASKDGIQDMYNITSPASPPPNTGLLGSGGSERCPTVTPLSPKGNQGLKDIQADLTNNRATLGSADRQVKGMRAAGKVCCDDAVKAQRRCYQCQKKDQQNVYRKKEEDRRAKEEEERNMMERLAQQDRMKIQMEKEREAERRNANQKVASFNLEEAARKRKERQEKHKQTPYVFSGRPTTQDKLTKQETYYKQLEDQINLRDSATKRQQQEQHQKEASEQDRLAEELAAEKVKQYRDKLAQQEDYRNALSEQVATRARPLPELVPNSTGPIFGNPSEAEQIEADKRKATRRMYLNQAKAIRDRKQKDEEQKRMTLEQEKTMLEKNCDDLRNDRADKYEFLRDQRRQLEDNWSRAIEDKRARDCEERDHVRKPAGLLHDRDVLYPRCGQCHRHITNWGETNVWRDTRYISGSKLIV